MLIIPAPIFSLAQAAWIPRLTIWRDDDTTERPLLPRTSQPTRCNQILTSSWLGGQHEREVHMAHVGNRLRNCLQLDSGLTTKRRRAMTKVSLVVALFITVLVLPV